MDIEYIARDSLPPVILRWARVLVPPPFDATGVPSGPSTKLKSVDLSFHFSPHATKIYITSNGGGGGFSSAAPLRCCECFLPVPSGAAPPLSCQRERGKGPADEIWGFGGGELRCAAGLMVGGKRGGSSRSSLRFIFGQDFTPQ